jgi:uncharacterized protein YndB with AHSA1/START domain
MNHSTANELDPKLDLMFDRIVDVPPEAVWLAWTMPEHLVKWFTPSPWRTVACDIDLRPGGVFSTIMRSPEGQEFANVGCYLEIINGVRLVWTNALKPGFRPCGKSADKVVGHNFFAFTAVISLAAHAKGTKYTAHVMHGDEDACKRHEQMGFRDGWGKALDQLVAMVKETKLR